MQAAENYNRYQRDFIIREIKKVDKDKKKILDFGAGMGTYADMLNDKNWQVDCVEIDPEETKILKTKGYKVYDGIEQVKTKYDVIYSLNVLEHIKDDAKALAALKACLSDQGVIIIYVPAFNLVFSQLDVIAEHFRRYRMKDIQQLADKTDMKVTVRYCDPVGFAGALVYRFLGGSGDLKPHSIYIFDKYLFPVSILLEPLTKNVFGKNALGVFAK
jgi:SAM-dependent methyltransferase